MTDDCGHGHPLDVQSWIAAGCELVLFVDGLGREHLRYQCTYCGKLSNGTRIEGRYRAGHLRVVTREPIVDHEPCSVRGCPLVPTERHHFAPLNVFGYEADLWPVAYLCTLHHGEWHDRMNGYDRYAKAVVVG